VGGYQLAFGIGAVLVAAAVVLGAVALRGDGLAQPDLELQIEDAA